MKKLLSLLMCYVFLQAETFALRGGPTSAGGPKVMGEYSGVLIDTSPGGDLGMFLLAAVTNGASSGQIVIFSQSATDSDMYTGIITGVSDATRGGSGKFFGVFSGNASTGSAAQRGIAGQATMSAVVTTANGGTQRLTGTGSARTVSVDPLTQIPTVGPLKSYIVDGWLTSLDSSGAGFTTNSGGG